MNAVPAFCPHGYLLFDPGLPDLARCRLCPRPARSTRRNVAKMVAHGPGRGYRPDWWTAEEDAAIVQLRSKGFTFLEIARRTGRSRLAVQRRLSRLKNNGDRRRNPVSP